MSASARDDVVRRSRPLLFALEPERAHDLALAGLAALGAWAPARRLVEGASRVANDALRCEVLGSSFENPLGVAAGLDKDARAFAGLAALGFGFIEVGTVTPRPQPGNPRPRMFRLEADAALVNRLGFNSTGARAVADRLSRLPAEARASCRLAVNVGKNRATPLADAASDYVGALSVLHDHADLVVVNVSSPNTPGLRDLLDQEPLGALVADVVTATRALAAARSTPVRPVLVKLSPDLSDAALDAALEVSAEAGAAGFVAANTTVSRPAELRSRAAAEAGGLSGAPLLPRSTEVVRRAFRRFDGRLPVVGVGGVCCARDAWRLVRAGASLVEAYTGLVYAGPRFAHDVLAGLAARVEAAGLRSIEEAVGADA